MAAGAWIVVGLGFGDEGKGSWVDFLCRKFGAHTVVRFNGGAQAGHHVVAPDGRHHTFSQFGAGTLAGARTYLSQYVMVNPYFLQAESKGLASIGVEDAYGKLTIHREALVTTPFHVSANRQRERARSARHGSCGMGIGETQQDALQHGSEALRVQDLKDPDILRKKLVRTQRERRQGLESPVNVDHEILWSGTFVEECMAFYEEFSKKMEIVGNSYFEGLCNQKGALVFEGAQGTLLDEDFGFHPYTTWSHTTSSNALRLIGGKPIPLKVIGALRGYSTRHGQGPFPTEGSSRVTNSHEHNVMGPWQGAFRTGALDLVLAKYAVECGIVREIALSHLDCLEEADEYKLCTRYRQGHQTTDNLPKPTSLPDQEFLGKALERIHPEYEILSGEGAFLHRIKKTLGLPITLCSHGPTAKDKTCLRSS